MALRPEWPLTGVTIPGNGVHMRLVPGFPKWLNA
jgi:hypothetical protein